MTCAESRVRIRTLESEESLCDLNVSRTKIAGARSTNVLGCQGGLKVERRGVVMSLTGGGGWGDQK
jgi:hypothetical protein